MLTYFCNDEEDFVVGIYSVDREADDIARLLGKYLEMDLVECDSDEYDEFSESDFTHDTVMLHWSQLIAYSDNIDSLSSKNINLYVVSNV